MKKTKPTTTPNPSTMKSRRRYLLLDAVARRVLNDSNVSWSSVGSEFTGRLLPAKGDTLSTITEKEVRSVIRTVLNDLIRKLDSRPIGSSDSTSDLKAILETVPRRKRG